MMSDEYLQKLNSILKSMLRVYMEQTQDEDALSPRAKRELRVLYRKWEELDHEFHKIGEAK